MCHHSNWRWWRRKGQSLILQVVSSAHELWLATKTMRSPPQSAKISFLPDESLFTLREEVRSSELWADCRSFVFQSSLLNLNRSGRLLDGSLWSPPGMQSRTLSGYFKSHPAWERAEGHGGHLGFKRSSWRWMDHPDKTHLKNSDPCINNMQFFVCLKDVSSLSQK